MQITLQVTKKQIILGVILIVLAAGAAFLFRDNKRTLHGTPPNAGKITTIEITAEGFKPDSVTIQNGDTVRFENKDSKPRWPASDPHPVHSQWLEVKGELCPPARGFWTIPPTHVNLDRA
jgi:hypothetical protein